MKSFTRLVETFSHLPGLISQEHTTVQATETELIKRAQSGDADAFADLVMAHQNFVYNLALRTINDPHEAEDLAQEAFIRAWQALPRFRHKSKFSTWLYRIVINLCYNRLPRLKRELAAVDSEEMVNLPDEGSIGPDSSLEADERRAYLHQQIEALPESYRLIITLRYQQELSYAEIARIADVPLGTVKTIIYRARARLREALQQYEKEPV